MDRNYTIDTLRTIAALLVIMIHVAVGYVNPGMKSQNFDLSFWTGNVLDSFSRICVPLFIMISGMFLIGRNETFRESYEKRAAKILIPLTFWSFLYLVYLITLRRVANVDPDIDSLLKSVILGQPFYHLWYLYMLIGLYLVTPILNLIIPIVSRRTLWAVSIGFLLFGMVHGIYNLAVGNNLIFLLWFIDYLGYYLIGYLIRDSEIRIPSSVWLITYIISGVLISLLSFYTARLWGNLYFYSFLSPLVIIASVSFFLWFTRLRLRENLFSRISHLTFGVYLIHAGILHFITYLQDASEIHLFDNAIIGVPVKFTISLSVSLMLSWILYNSRFLKRTI